MVYGILLGFGAAFCQSVSYLFSKRFVHKYNNSNLALLATSHIIMGAISLALVGFFWPRDMLAFRVYGWSLAGSALFYMAGQVCLFGALAHTSASRISPLLGLKVILLAFISMGVLKEHFSPYQLLAVLMCAMAAVMLGWSGGWIKLQSALWVLLACVGYCCSDINIKFFVSHFSGMGLAHAAAFTTCLCYILCGVVSLIILFFIPKPRTRLWIDSAPFAVAWLAAMFLLFGCFGAIGVVHGNIIQSSRGLISILLGVAVAMAGHEHLEEKITIKVLARRIFAAIIMIVAIAIFSIQQIK